jgi:xanthine dehydrogenase accessory factor
MSAKIFEKAVEMLRGGRDLVLATIIGVDGSAPQKPGARFLVAEDGETFGTIGGINMERAIVAEAPGILRSLRPKRLRFTLDLASATNAGLICGGEVEVYVEPIVRDPRLVVIGAGHVGRALAAAAKPAGFEVIVVDEPESPADTAGVPGADRVVRGDNSGSIEAFGVDRSTFVVILTSGHRRDSAYLSQVLKTPAAYVGMIGSRTKREHVFSMMREAGIAEAALSKVHTPVGLDIGAVSPGEIAVSILAEMIAVRHGVAGPYPSLAERPQKGPAR